MSFWKCNNSISWELFITFPQDDDEADTVGCCTLKVENVTAEGYNKLKVFEPQYLSTFLSVFLVEDDEQQYVTCDFSLSFGCLPLKLFYW
jgi:hypothetical protein